MELLRCSCKMAMEKIRIVEARDWRELPEVLEPGVYIIAGERIEVEEKVSRDALKRTIEIMKKRGGIYI